MSLAVRSSAALLLLAYLAFISLGLPDAVLGVAWPSLRGEYQIGQALLGVPLAVAAVAYFLSGLLAGRLMQAIGVGGLLAGSTALVAAGVFGFSAAPAFVLFLAFSPVVGFGSGAIDSALNTYAARNFSPRHMSWLHAAYSAGAMAGPAIMTAVLVRGESWRTGYLTIGAVLAALTVAFIFARRRWEAPPVETTREVGEPAALAPRTTGLSALRQRSVRLQIAIFFFYTGLEVCAGQWSYTLLTEARGLSAPVAGVWVTGFWGGVLVGRLVLGLVVERIGQVRLLRLSIFGSLLFAALFAIPGQAWSAAALPFLAFSLASIYPGLMAETPRRVGEHTAPHAVGFQVSAATAGVAVMPSVAGLVSERFGLDAVGLVIAGAALTLLLLHERMIRTVGRTP